MMVITFVQEQFPESKSVDRREESFMRILRSLVKMLFPTTVAKGQRTGPPGKCLKTCKYFQHQFTDWFLFCFSGLFLEFSLVLMYTSVACAVGPSVNTFPIYIYIYM